MDFSLYRGKVFFPSQREMFTAEAAPSQLIRDAIRSRPTVEVGPSLGWQIGNVEEIDSRSLYFALGRNSRSKLSVVDRDTGNFTERSFESAPYTHVIVDIQLELFAIASKTNLARTTDAAARQLAKLLSASRPVVSLHATVQLSPIPETERFLAELERAYAISSYTVFFTRPNPFDAEELFHKPMERLTAASGATKGKATLTGESLDPQALIELTRSAASTGDDASARIKEEAGSRPVTRSLKKGANAQVAQDSIENQDDKASLLERIRDRYHAIRGSSND